MRSPHLSRRHLDPSRIVMKKVLVVVGVAVAIIGWAGVAAVLWFLYQLGRGWGGAS